MCNACDYVGFGVVWSAGAKYTRLDGTLINGWQYAGRLKDFVSFHNSAQNRILFCAMLYEPSESNIFEEIRQEFASVAFNCMFNRNSNYW